MKAHILKEKTGEQVVGTHIILNDHRIMGSIPYSCNGVEGIMGFHAIIGIELDVDNRNINIDRLNFSRITTIVGQKQQVWHHELWIDDDAQLLLNEATHLVSTMIEENKEHILDNHHDFYMGVSSTYDDVQFSNTGGEGYLCLTMDESMQDNFDEGDKETGSFEIAFEPNYYEVGFIMNYNLQLVNDAAVLSDIEVTLDDYDKFIKIDGNYQSTSGHCDDLDADLIQSLKRRVAETVQSKFSIIKSDITDALNGVAS